MVRFVVKLSVIALTAIAGTLYLTFSSTSISTARNDDILIEIAGYRNWTKVNNEPIKVVTSSPSGKSSGFSIDINKTATEGG